MKELACLVMDQAGGLHRAKNQPLNQRAPHAGKSSWDGRNDISKYCMGIEVVCPGKVELVKSGFYPWWQMKDGKSVPGAKPLDDVLVRTTPSKDNTAAGHYYRFTTAQEKALHAFVMWQLEVNPEFSISWVVGHDEISSDRKTDPGGSLSMTMPAFRNKLQQSLNDLKRRKKDLKLKTWAPDGKRGQF